MRGTSSILTATAVLAFSGAALASPVRNARRQASWPNPEPCTGNCSYIHDPSVIRHTDGTYYRFSTNGDIAIASAPSINGPWTYLHAMLPGGSVIHAVPNQEIWAPDVSFIGGTYYAYYAVSTIGSQQSDIGVATTTDPSGTWTDHGSIGIPKSSSYNLIDPNLFQHDANSPFYLSFGSGWNAVYQTTMDSSLLTMAGGATQNNEVFNSTFPAGGTYPSITEGSYQYWLPVNGNTYYYMFFSSGTCCNTPPNLSAPGDEYKIMVCRSDSPTGPFVDANGLNCLTQNGGTLVLGSHDDVYAPGGQGVMTEPASGRPIVYYHYAKPSVGYNYEQFFFGFNFLDFSSGWPVVTT